MPGTQYTGGRTEEYILGRGIVYFDGDAPSLYTKGFRDLGNAPEFTVTLSGEEKEHQSFLEGLKTIDLSLLVSQKMEISFTLEEANTNNLALFFLGTERGLDSTGVAMPNMSALASDNATFIDAGERNVWITNIALFLWYDLKLTVNAATAAALNLPPPTGPGVTGATFKAYDFEAGQIVSTTDVFKNPTSRTNNAGGTVLVERTAANPTGDYELDRKMGRIRFFVGVTSVGPTNNISVHWAAPAVAKAGTAGFDNALTRVEMLTKSGVKGAVVFVMENAASGHKHEFRFHQVTLKPDGDFSGIGEEVAGMTFRGVCEAISVSPFGGSKYGDVVTRTGFST